jgi:uncharacterized membrane-anchored protein YhcB (DUF1043 family)
MFTPLVQILVYLAVTFVLGLALGWLLWKFGGSTQSDAMTTEIDYWKQRLDQSRNERDLEQDKIAVLERERDNLKKRLAAAKPQS